MANPKTAPEPTPPGAYNPADHINMQRQGSTEPLPGLKEALSTAAGTPIPDPEPPAQPEVKAPVMPDDDKPAPHVKFIAADDQEPPAQKAKATPEPAKPEPAKDDHPKRDVSQLREAYEKLKGEFASTAAERDLTRKEVAEFKDKATRYEERIKALEAAELRAKELEERVVTYDERLRVTDYLNHPEFHEKFVKPVADAIQSAHALVAEMVVDADGEARQATPQDFDMVLRAPNLTEASRRAKELFGPDLASTIVERRQAVLMAEKARQEAVKSAGVKSEEWLKAQQARAAEQRGRAKTEFERISQQLQEKYPQLYRPPEGDKDAEAARKSGEELAKLILEGQPAEMPPDQYLTNVAKIYHRAASFPMRELMVNRLQQENDALKAKLAAYEKSTPDAEGRKVSDGSTAGKPQPGDMKAQMLESLTSYSKRNR